MTGFVTQPESFRPAAQGLRSAAEQLATAWAPVRAQSVAVRFGRGDDVLSPLIQVSLEAAVAMVDDCLTSSAQALADVADGLEQMGQTYRAADDEAAVLFGPTAGG